MDHPRTTPGRFGHKPRLGQNIDRFPYRGLRDPKLECPFSFDNTRAQMERSVQNLLAQSFYEAEFEQSVVGI